MQKFGNAKKMHYLCTEIKQLDHGVMVTLQVLVLSLWVRVPLVQPQSDDIRGYSVVIALFVFDLVAKSLKFIK